MITERELTAVTLSPTKKDFYQIWNELLDTADKISARWSPASTNEADPGVILLKVLTAVADKLNYNIDKNILEAFMPSATQEDAMRKLCDILGYSMKYYRSATTPLTITYSGNQKLDEDVKIEIPKFATVTNVDEDLVYCLVTPVTFNDEITTRQVEAIQGTIQDCVTNNGKIITLANIDENNRYYLPESQVAENGIFINSVSYVVNNDESVATEGESWISVNNLNTQNIGSRVYKFSFDSKEQIPYIQFPDDISAIIEDGIYIKYIRTDGINGNAALRTLNKFQNITDSWKVGNWTEDSEDLESILSVTNQSVATNGANKESINDAYNNYKKTIGTFDTLITCRDYMNKIYQMLKKDLDPDNSSDTTPLVSNIIVSDIRDDLNRSITLCTFDEYGINYVEESIKDDNDEDKINCFNLVLYPFTTVRGTGLIQEYKNSFKYDATNLRDITSLLEDNKTISHTFVNPDAKDIVCIKNYLKLNAKITTTYKISGSEERVILNNIYRAIYNNFNMRKLDFGEEIPFDSILNTIQEADNRIKNISLDEPELETKFCLQDGTEVSVKDDNTGKAKYNQLALRNVLAGRISLFEYNESFKPDLSETALTGYAGLYPTGSNKIVKLTSKYDPSIETDPETSAMIPITLNDNEVIQFMLPNFTTEITYPGYINYWLTLGTTGSSIKKNTDYQLKANEYLFINYTPAAGDDGKEKDPINKVYDEGTIVRFNFDVQNSSDVAASGTTPPKHSGFSFDSSYHITDMYTFGPSEQCEIRKPVEVVLGGGSAEIINIYWQRDDDLSDKYKDSDTIPFVFDEDNISSDPTHPNYTAYTLKEGEYFYYTDKNKLDFAYYGNGTKIKRSPAFPNISKFKTDNDISTEDIMTYGLAAAIPWVSLTVDSTKYLTLKEYQYITLTSGDKLLDLKFSPTDPEDPTSLPTKLDYDWQTIDSATYQFASSETSEKLPDIKVGTIKWQGRSKLEFNMGPDTTQTLYKDDHIYVFYAGNDTSTEDVEFLEGASLKSNYDCINSTNSVDVKVYKTIGGIPTAVNDFKIKPFEKNEIKSLQTGNTIPWNNYGTNWTKLNFENNLTTYDITSPYTTINALFPADNFGLLMIYYIPFSKTKADNAYLKTTARLTIFNNNESWWETVVDDKYYLRDGINIIKIPVSTSIDIYADTKEITDATTTQRVYAGRDVLIIGNLDIITDGSEINKKINYYGIDDNLSKYQQILKDIKKVDPDLNFYYNVVIDNATSIDLNPYNEKETLDNPYTWYSYNNINNKFVISEINADELANGITIAKSSKL